MIYDLTKELVYKIQFGLTWLEYNSSARNLLYVPYFLKYSSLLE